MRRGDLARAIAVLAVAGVASAAVIGSPVGAVGGGPRSTAPW